jgi:hypothetical protein
MLRIMVGFLLDDSLENHYRELCSVTLPRIDLTVELSCSPKY